MEKMDLKKSRSLMYVRRLNYERCNRYENVAEHSFYVGLMAYQLACSIGLDEAEARYCLKMGLMHDLPEAVTGDIPFLTRRAMGKVACAGIDELGAQEMGVNLGTDRQTLEIVQIADALEFALYLKEEMHSGNYNLQDIYAETLGRLVPYLEGYSKYICGILQMDSDTIIKKSKELPNAIKH
jgi:5'-deoxynucleotidase YfbR-like HD superfamily hydrolase